VDRHPDPFGWVVEHDLYPLVVLVRGRRARFRAAPPIHSQASACPLVHHVCPPCPDGLPNRSLWAFCAPIVLGADSDRDGPGWGAFGGWRPGPLCQLGGEPALNQFVESARVPNDRRNLRFVAGDLTACKVESYFVSGRGEPDAPCIALCWHRLVRVFSALDVVIASALTGQCLVAAAEDMFRSHAARANLVQSRI